MARAKKPKYYTDAYYAKDGYRTKQYRAKLEASGNYGQPIPGYEFNEFSNRRTRRNIARSKGVFKFGIWKDTLKRLKNVQTFVKKEEINDK